jgi:hypothetical protein
VVVELGLELVGAEDAVLVEAELVEVAASLDVPLPEVAVRVARVGQPFAPGVQVGAELRPVRFDAVGDVDHPVDVGQHAGHETRPRRRADGIGRVTAVEPRAGLAQFVQRRSLALRVRVNGSALLLICK